MKNKFILLPILLLNLNLIKAPAWANGVRPNIQIFPPYGPWIDPQRLVKFRNKFAILTFAGIGAYQYYNYNQKKKYNEREALTKKRALERRAQERLAQELEALKNKPSIK